MFNMRLVLILAFIVIPVLELTLLYKIGQWAGLWLTIAMVLGIAFVGTQVLRWQGLATLARAKAALEHGQAPIPAVLEGVLLLLAGALMITPGLITDLAGIMLLIPPVRRRLARAIVGYFMRHGELHVHVEGAEAVSPGQPRGEPGSSGRFRNSRAGPSGPGSGGRRGPNVIEGQFERIDEEPPAKDQPR